jgi:hypothetical protein
MKFFAGFVTAIIIMVVAAVLVAWTYDVAASVPDTAIEFVRWRVNSEAPASTKKKVIINRTHEQSS